MMGETQVLDYRRLVDDYEAGLTDKLRAFGAEESFLELWVPDQDMVKSLANLFHAANEAGHPRTTVILDRASASAFDREMMKSEFAALADFTFTPHDDGNLTVTASSWHTYTPTQTQSPKGATARRSGPENFVASHATPHAVEQATEPETISAPYRKKVLDAATTAEHCGPLEERDGLALVTGCHGDARLVFRASPDTGIIDAVAYGGVRRPPAQGLLEVLAVLAPGLTVQEVAEHAAIRLEAELRETNVPPPVPGVALPRAADPAFRWLELLTRAALADWYATTHNSVSVNEFDDAPGAIWLATPADARAARIEEALQATGASEGIDVTGVSVQAIEWDVRVVLRLPESFPDRDKGHVLMQLERGVQRLVDRRLEVFSEELSDKNVIRRLT